MASSRNIGFAVLSFVFVLFAFSEAKVILVGDKDVSWNVDSVKALAQWAENRRFRIGYVLKWKKEEGRDSVVQVTKEAYETCDTSKPIKADVEEITLDRSGPFYFISGVKEHCDKGLKLTVVVLTEKPKYGSYSPLPAPAAPPSSNAAAPGFSLSAGFIAVVVAVGMALI
ncbi:hypothetical protein ACFX1X_026209 [Malus domestica]